MIKNIVKHATLITALTASIASNANSDIADNAQWVDPFIGTGGDGHLFPGAVTPFGMVQLSPDTDEVFRGIDPQPEIYKRCAGYHYDDSTITGFSHTHFSGTGHSDLGDLLIMPMTGEAHTQVGDRNHPETGYRSRYSHDNETHKINRIKNVRLKFAIREPVL